MQNFDENIVFSKEELQHNLWSRRGFEYIIDDSKESFKLDDSVTMIHRHPILHKDMHKERVTFPVRYILERSIGCPYCQPKLQHDYGVKLLREYFKDKMGLRDDEVEEQVIESEGHIYDFLIRDKLVVHYFDSSYFINFFTESDEMKAMLSEFEDNEDYDLFIVVYTDILELEKGRNIVLEGEMFLNE